MKKIVVELQDVSSCYWAGMQEFLLINTRMSLKEIAVFSCIAEHLGYSYDGISARFPVRLGKPVYKFSRMPDAEERYGRMLEEYPMWFTTGEAPGVQPGDRGFHLDWDTTRHVELLLARIKVDMHEHFTLKRRLLTAASLCFVVPVPLLVVNACEAESMSDYMPRLTVFGGLALLIMLSPFVAKGISYARVLKYRRMLTQQNKR